MCDEDSICAEQSRTGNLSEGNCDTNTGNVEEYLLESQVAKLTLSSGAYQQGACKAMDMIYVCPFGVRVPRAKYPDSTIDTHPQKGFIWFSPESLTTS